MCANIFEKINEKGEVNWDYNNKPCKANIENHRKTLIIIRKLFLTKENKFYIKKINKKNWNYLLLSLIIQVKSYIYRAVTQ